jgi:chromosome partitioning protein
MASLAREAISLSCDGCFAPATMQGNPTRPAGRRRSPRGDDNGRRLLHMSSTVNRHDHAPDAIVVAFANQKGGVGKTTTAVNAAVLFAQQGFRVLLVDFDPQGNATSSLGLDKRDLATTVYDVMVGRREGGQVVQRDVRPNLDLLPATPTLAAAEIELVQMRDRERVLRRALQKLANGYDLILIDCPPSLGLLTVNSLTASDYVVVPIQCEFLALEGLGQLISTIDLVKRQLNPALDVLGVVMTMYDARTRLSASVVEEVRKYFPQRIFSTLVPRSIRLAEAPSFGMAIAEYDAASRGAQAYQEVVDELSARLKLSLPNNQSSPELAIESAAS